MAKAKKVKKTENDIKNLIENAPEIKPEPPQPLMRELPPATPFPLEALGKLLGDTAKAIKDKTQAPMAICGQSVLAAATLAVQGHADVCLPNGQKKPVSSYYLTMAESGERKTACDSEALNPIRRHEEELRNNYKLETVQHNLMQEVWEGNRKIVVGECVKEGKSKEEVLGKVATEIGFAPSPPPIPMKTYPEATYEGLVKLLDKGHASIGLFSSEGGQFIGGHGMTPEAKLRTATGLSSIWDGEPIKRVRGGDGVHFINGKRLAAHLMCQPEVANLILGDEMLAGQGLPKPQTRRR